MLTFNEIKQTIFIEASKELAPFLLLDADKDLETLQIVLLPIIEDILVALLNNRSINETDVGMEKEAFSKLLEIIKKN